MVKGIDVSKHNGNVDWEKIKADGIEFAIIRIGWGNDSTEQDDPTANRNMDECERLGIPYGVYIYSYALNENDAVSEANHTLRMIKNRNVQVGIWFDMEDADGYKAKNNIPLNVANSELYTKICATFTTEIQSAGYKNVGIYASKSVLEDIIGKEYLKHGDVKVWVAQWSEKCTYSGKYDMWQYTSDGAVAGSSARTDMNYYYGKIGKQTNNDISTQSTTAYAIGQHVIFSTCYKSSTDDISKHIPATNMARNHGIITNIVTGAKNPYLLDDGLCWVNDGDIRGLYQSKYYSEYNGTSFKVDEVLRSIGVPESYIGSWKKRKPIAEKINISNYEGTEEQNNKIISMAKQGKIPVIN